jgi:hypothetical protein
MKGYMDRVVRWMKGYMDRVVRWMKGYMDRVVTVCRCMEMHELPSMW